MKIRFLSVAVMGLVLCAGATAQDAGTPPPEGQGPGAGAGRGQGRGWGGMMSGRGMMGTVTEAGSDHFKIRTESGEIRTINFSVNTRIVKQPAQRPSQGAERIPPEPIKAGDIKVGDAIAASGEVDGSGKSVGAVFIVQLDPERARQMREMQANFGKTWLMGKVIAVHEVKITLLSPVDNAPHTFVADENTAFRKRRDPITLADVQVGDTVRVEGAQKDGDFVAATVAVMGAPPNGAPMPRHDSAPQ